MSEKADFRVNLELINQAFPNKAFLNLTETAQYTGVDKRCIKSTWGCEFRKVGNRLMINKVTLARLIS